METDSSTPLLGSFDSRAGSFAASREYLGSINRTANAQRRPFHYPLSAKGHIENDTDLHASATYNRYVYYSKLADPSVETLKIPDHVIPPYFFYPFPIKWDPKGKQSSIVTIFTIWNTMMGTSLLSIPWAIQRAGFACALVLLVVMAATCLYTAYRILTARKDGDLPPDAIELSDVSRHILGRAASWASMLFSMITLVGGLIVYWVLMSNFLYNTVLYLYETFSGSQASSTVYGNSSYDMLCAPEAHYNPILNATNHSGEVTQPNSNVFYKVWDLYSTVPVFLLIFIGPMVNLKSPTFFSKFSAIGTLSVLYLNVFVVVQAIRWGIHFDVRNVNSLEYVSMFQTTFPIMMGILSLAYFIHNCILSLVINQRHPENNTRDLSIGYCLVATTYLIIGVSFFISFPLPKDCIEDNFLNNFQSSNILAFVTRVFLLLQVVTLYPLLMYLVRVQFMHFVFNSVYPGAKQVFCLNSVLLAICVLFAIYMPKIGTIIRFCGAFSALVCTFALPSLFYMKILYKKKKKLSCPVVTFHTLLITVGIANCILQFFM